MGEAQKSLESAMTILTFKKHQFLGINLEINIQVRYESFINTYQNERDENEKLQNDKWV